MKLAWSRSRTLAAGTALIVLSNAVALLGVAYNRGGEPESRLPLTQRELWRPYRFGYDREAADTALTLRWRVLAADAPASIYAGSYGTPEWLDQAKLAALGFDLPAVARTRTTGYYRQLPREALVVLELDGPAYRKALERARELVAKEAAGDAAGPGRKGQRAPGQPMADWLKREETSNSRLFAVDAGLDAAALRAKYPDRARYAIVRGNIRAQLDTGRSGDTRWTGRIEGLQSDQVSLPIELRRAIGPVARSGPWGAVGEEGAPFQAVVAFGRKFEPWIVAASPGQPATPPSKK